MAIKCASAFALVCSVGASRFKRADMGSKVQIAGVPVMDHHLMNEDHSEWIALFSKNEKAIAFCDQFDTCTHGVPQHGTAFAALSADKETLSKFLAGTDHGVEALVPDFEIDNSFEEPTQYGFSTMSRSRSRQAFPTWGVEMMGARETGLTGRGVDVYVADSGVRCTHEEFEDRCIPTLKMKSSWGRVSAVECKGAMNCATDSRGHGTHCAGSVGAKTYGVAPKATIRAVDRGSKFSHSYKVFEWIINNRGSVPSVVSLSVQTSRTKSADVAVQGAVDAGITVIVAAGNFNSDSCTFSFASAPAAITVGSVNIELERSNFSNWGSCNTIYGPGSDITSLDYKSDTGLAVKSGTSMATPHVAGAAALLLESNPRLTQGDIQKKFLSTAVTGKLTKLHDSDPNYLVQC